MTSKTPHIKPAIYARISQDPNETQLGITRQLEDCRGYARARGWPEPVEYVDNNISAFSGAHRPDYERLLEDMRLGIVNTVVVSLYDRLSRRLRTTIDLCDVLLENGVALHDLSGEVDLRTPTGISMFQMAAVMAENKVRVDQANNRRMRKQLAEQGKRHMTRRPYGWQACGMKLDPVEAPIVRELTERLIDGETATAIATDLNRRGVPTVTGAKWTGIGVKVCARRASNAGLRSHHGTIYDGTWEPIVTREQWERVCSVLSRPARAWRRGTGRKYPFTGFVRCGACGNAMNVANGRGNSGVTAYRCDPYKSADRQTRTGCGQVQRSQVPVDWLIREAIIDRLSGDGLAQAMQDLATQDQAVSGVLDELTSQRQRLDDLVADYSTGLLSREEFAKAKALATARVGELEQRAASITGGSALRRADWSEGVRAMIEGADLHLLRDLAEMLIDQVAIDPMPRSGYRVRYAEIDGRRWRFDPDYVKVSWRV